MNVTMQQYNLFYRRQSMDKTTDNNITALKNIGKQWEFLSVEDNALRQIFSLNVNLKISNILMI